MAVPDVAHRKVEDYLQELRRALRPLPAEEALEIVEEIRSHVLDSAEQNGGLSEERLDTALGRLGRAAELAAMYVTESLVRRAEVSRSPWLALRSIFRWATLSVAGFFVFLGSLIGYGIGASFVVCALVKPFAPGRVGLWKLADPADDLSFSLGWVNRPDATDLLGWWIIPVGLAIGLGLIFLTARFGLWSLRWFHQTRPVPPL